MQIKNTAVIITGAASGMGAATAAYLSQQGAKVALLDKSESVRQVAKEINAFGEICDVTDPDSVAGAIEMAKKVNGVARVCINCAGIAPAKRIVGREGPMSLTEFANVIQINLIGTFNVLRLAANDMTKLEPVDEDGSRGVIINTASIAAFEGQIGQAAYSASKGGVASLTLPAAREFAQFGVRVNCVAPGLIGTPMLLSMPSEVQQSLASTIPFPKRFGKPEEFARLVGHIIENDMLNGEVIRLDGALRMQAK